MMEFNLEGRFAISRLGKAVAETLSRPGARQDFEEWYHKRYGKDYVWKYAKKGEEKEDNDTKNCEARF